MLSLAPSVVPYQHHPSSSRALAIPEVVLQILSNFSPSQDRDSLAQCARICMGCVGPARSILYTNLNVTWSFTEGTQLQDSLEGNPSLSKLVKSFKVTGYDNESLEKDARESVDWNDFVKSIGYFFDKEDPEAREMVWEETANIRLAKVEALMATHQNRVWIKGNHPDGDIPRFQKPIVPPSLLTILQNLSSLNIEAGSDSRFERIIVAASPNVHSLQLHSPPRELNLPPFPNLRHLVLTPSGYEAYEDSLPLPKCMDTLETLIVLRSRWRSRMEIPPNTCLPRLSHLHISPSFDVTHREITPVPYSEAAPHIKYFSVDLKLYDTNAQLVLGRLANLIPDEVHTIDATLSLYQLNSLGHLKLLSEVQSEMISPLIEGLPGNVRRVRISLLQSEQNLNELRTLAQYRGMELEIEFWDGDEAALRDSQGQKMLEDWKVNHSSRL